MKKILFFLLFSLPLASSANSEIDVLNAELKSSFENLINSAQEGDMKSIASLGDLYSLGVAGVEKNDAKSILYYELAAAGGYPEAQYLLGIKYAQGDGVPQDYLKSKKYFESAASKKHPQSLIMLGVIYKNGYGVRQDNDKAKEYFGLSCDNGLQEACEEYKEMK